MNEKTKLDEAKYFYKGMSREFYNRQNLNYELSAFLTAARSVLQYGLAEVNNKKNGKQWYRKQIAQSKVLSFFIDKRDLNIHDEPVRPK